MIRKLFPALIGLAIFTAAAQGAEAPSYKVDTSFDGTGKVGVIYMDAMPDDGVCYVDGQGKVCVIDDAGKELKSFTPELKGKAVAIAADKKGKIYVFSTVFETVEQKRRGKTYKRQMPTASHCTVCDKDGNKERDIELKGIKQIRAARIINDKIAVADPTQRAVVFADMETGETSSKTEAGIRICCGIFDFCAGPENSIMVANLGAFKVQSYTADGKTTQAFGKRGKALNDFHGCCNPVSVASLSNGAIVTAEKSPTRVKIYDSTGENAKQIEGIEELVKGCSHIPMAADSKGNVYLASRRKGMIKCVSAE